jgi:hypothetical protein
MALPRVVSSVPPTNSAAADSAALLAAGSVVHVGNVRCTAKLRGKTGGKSREIRVEHVGKSNKSHRRKENMNKKHAWALSA